MSELVTVVSPSQAFESMQFFGALLTLLTGYLEKGAPSKLLGALWTELFAEVERPSRMFSRGAGCQGTLLNLSLKLLEPEAAHRRSFESALVMHLAEHSGSRTRKEPGTTPSTQRIPADKWKAAVALLEKSVKPKKVDGVDRKPCACFFILGECKNSTCKLLHWSFVGISSQRRL